MIQWAEQLSSSFLSLLSAKKLRVAYMIPSLQHILTTALWNRWDSKIVAGSRWPPELCSLMGDLSFGHHVPSLILQPLHRLSRNPQPESFNHIFFQNKGQGGRHESSGGACGQEKEGRVKVGSNNWLFYSMVTLWATWGGKLVGGNI